MKNKQLIWLGCLVAAGILTSNSVVAQTNQSDSSGSQTFSAPTVSIDSRNGNGIRPTTQFNPVTGEISGGGINNPIRFGGLSGSGSGNGFGNASGNDSGTSFGNASGNASGTGFGNNSGNASGNASGTSSGTNPGDGSIGSSDIDGLNGSSDGLGNPLECSNSTCLEQNQPREVTLNEVAEALENGLEQSLDNLAAAENNAKLANNGPRRIARRDAGEDSAGDIRACINPAHEAREIVEKQLIETEKFIEQVNQIEPHKNIW